MSVLNADKWLCSVLEADATLQGLTVNQKIYQDLAPEFAAYPFISLQFVDGLPVQNATADKIMTDEVWIVKAVGKGDDYTTLEPIVERIGQVLHKASGEGVIGCVEEEIFRYSEEDSGTIYKHLGHYYRIVVSC
jgi:hypothetical protein